ncbi:hypothetical protein IFM89_005029 [Coptis chinensis]|uniref:RING-type domain-containing protein n=1 Tax=Coptis chinensis TaxID=261450 RepID=A0A835LMB0_9MAGN|nr:hypothetical protein IFM89_005029 [Coptis chinensis]
MVNSRFQQSLPLLPPAIRTAKCPPSTGDNKQKQLLQAGQRYLGGTLLGAITGAVTGQETGCGLFRGAAIGSVSGALLSIEIDVLGSVLSGRLVRERVGAMMLCPMRNRMDEIEASSDEVLDIFETEAKGLPSDLVENIPIIEITTQNNVDSCGEKIPCSVCLQNFQIGDTVRNLPYCHHMFHRHCIDQWLIKQGSCPLCRSDL